MTLPDSAECGSLGVPHLKRIWAVVMAARSGAADDRKRERNWDRTVLNAVGLGLHQTLQFLFISAPTFPEFEDWIVSTAGKPDQLCVERLRAIIAGQPYTDRVAQWLRTVEDTPSVLSDEDLSFWEDNGYVVLKEAVSIDGCCSAEKAIWDYVDAASNLPDSWYRSGVDHGIMVELIQHPALEVNRRAERIHKAFAQLWGTADLWSTADRCGFHPPQRDDFPFPGPDLHWDIDFNLPLEFGTQGILYLTDTPPEQGALTVVPGFHKRLFKWLSNLPQDADPQQEDLHALGSVPIGGDAGDMVIWNHLLPHGSRPNLGKRPRLVQYINMLPCGYEGIV